MSPKSEKPDRAQILVDVGTISDSGGRLYLDALDLEGAFRKAFRLEAADLIGSIVAQYREQKQK